MMSVNDADILEFDADKYADQVHQELVEKHTVILSLVFSVDGKFLVGASGSGRVAVWDVVSALSGNPERSKAARRPAFAFQACSDAIYSLKFVQNLLVCGTNTDIRGYRWTDLLGTSGGDSQVLDRYYKPAFVVQPPSAAASLVGAVETNGIASQTPPSFAEQASKTGCGNTLYSACGDSQTHAWDLNHNMRLVNSFEGHTDYVHCVEVRQNGQVVTGSEDGTVRLWDRRTFQCVNVLEPPTPKRERGKSSESGSKDKVSSKTRSTSSKAGVDSKSRGKREHSTSDKATPWIPCIALDSTDNWLATGGLHSPILWHIPSLTPASQPKTKGQNVVRAVVFSDDEIMTVGDNSNLCGWSMGGELKYPRGAVVVSFTHTRPCSAQATGSSSSNYAVCINTAGPKVLAMAGVGARVDIFINFGYRAFSLDFF